MKKFSRSFKIITFLALSLLGWVLLAPLLAYILVVEKPIEKAEAIWVMGGSGAYLERTQFAAELYRNGVTTKIFLVNDGQFGGWNRVEQRNLPFYEISQRELIAQGVPKESIEVIFEHTTGTDFEADLFAKIAKERQLQSILLVTSAYHSRRTLWTFQKSIEKNNLNIEIGLQSPEVGIQTPPKFTWWLNRKGWRDVGGEYVKFVYYWISFD